MPMEEFMATTAAIPVSITPEAAVRVGELGLERELEVMLEHTRVAVPGVHMIDVLTDEALDEEDESGLILRVWTDRPTAEDDPQEWEWQHWKVQTFPPEVCRHFVMWTVHGSNHAR
jgi:hypothetical protein